MSPPNGHANGSPGSQDQHSIAPVLAPGWNTTTHYTAEQIKEFVALLEVPFDPMVIEWRVTNTTKGSGQSRGQVIPYADQRAYTDRLNALFSPAGWTRKYTVHTSANFQRAKDQKTTAKVFVTCDLTIFGIGSHSATGEEWTDDENAGTAAEAQAFKRSCACFGLGRYLYHFTGTWVDLDDRKRPKTIPKLVDWATPEGWRQGLRPGQASHSQSSMPTRNDQAHQSGRTQGIERELVQRIEGMAELLGKPYTALAMVPPHLVEKWAAREAFLTIPGIRVFLIDDLRNGGDEKTPHGINEVRLKSGRIVREGLQTTLSDMRLKKQYESSRKRWASICSRPALFIVGRERAKLGYFWRHAYRVPRSGPSLGCVVNSDTGKPVIVDDGRLTVADFRKVKIAEIIEAREEKPCNQAYSPMWQADPEKIHRMAPIEFIGRYMPGWFDYAICDEIHQLAGDTAQGNALGTLASCTDKIVGLTGTLLGGYADDLFNTLFRLEPRKMKQRGYEFGTAGHSAFAQDYGVLETITKIEPAENACSKAKATTTIRRKPGASPLLFGEFLMDLCAFVFLEDISGELPPYEETCVSVPMEPLMRAAYSELEDAIRTALKEHRGNRSVLSIMLHTLLLYPDHPYGLGSLYATEFDPQLQRKVKFLIAHTRDLPQDRLHAKERRLVEEIKRELAEGRRCQVFAVYTQKRDVTARLREILANEGIRTAVLKANVDTSKREAWYAKQVKDGVQVVIGHPKLVETGLDLLDFPTIIFYESGYSLHTLRQASRRSWRIGQAQPVRVKFLCYEGTMQGSCLRLMGKKLLVALTMEGKFAGEGLQSMDEDDDMLSAMARELVEKNGIGDTADAVWRSLNEEHQKLFPAVHNAAETDGACVPTPISEGPQATELIEAAISSGPVLVFGQSSDALRSSRRRPRPTSVPEQPSLFNWN